MDGNSTYSLADRVVELEDESARYQQRIAELEGAIDQARTFCREVYYNHGLSGPASAMDDILEKALANTDTAPE